MCCWGQLGCLAAEAATLDGFAMAAIESPSWSDSKEMGGGIDAFLAFVWTSATLTGGSGGEWERLHMRRLLLEGKIGSFRVGNAHARKRISVLHVAVLFDRQMVAAALEVGAFIDEEAHTPAQVAMLDAHTGGVAGTMRTFTPLEVAIAHRRMEAAVQLLRYGARVRGTEGDLDVRAPSTWALVTLGADAQPYRDLLRLATSNRLRVRPPSPSGLAEGRTELPRRYLAERGTVLISPDKVDAEAERRRDAREEDLAVARSSIASALGARFSRAAR